MENMLVPIREALGISQSELGEFLAVHRSRVNHAERGERRLNGLILERAARLSFEIESFSEETKPANLIQFEEEYRKKRRNSYELAQRKVNKQLSFLKDKLEEYHRRYRQGAIRFQVAENFSSQNESETVWLNWLLSQGKVLVEKYGPEARKKLEIRIEQLEMEALYYQQTIHSITPLP